jgi:alkanesulfonate monooxygenase SsuD/methylene tetrahydromethanopterin reductase-like flavin-dependent oxidoreductase (luciferase family)
MPTVGVAIQAFNAHDFVTQVRQAEMTGIPVAWTTIGGAGGADPLTVFAAALTATDQIRLGTGADRFRAPPPRDRAIS